MMTFEQQWIEFDYNPFVLFNADGKILSLNAEAQYLMGAIDTSTIFEIAKTHASKSFGFKTIFIDLEFGRFKFFGITVGYESEDEIGIRLYQAPSFKFNKPKEDLDLVNIYALIELCISSNSINNTVRFEKEFDPTIPEIRLHADTFIKILNKVYTAMLANKSIATRLYYRVGEHIKYEGKKYALIAIELSSEEIDRNHISEIKQYATEHNIFLVIKKNKVTINVPMVVK
jgi:hypothetical protein